MKTTAAESSAPRAPTGRQRVPYWPVAVLWFVLMAPLARWGLPTGEYDATLFGGQPAWEAKRYEVDAALAARRNRQAGADTDLNPVGAADGIVHLTASEAARAEILRRYRLFSRQPDEMITFMSLQRMNPRAGDLDPKLYQYGGGFIYLFGAALGVTSVLGLTHLTSDAGYYLAHPEAFGGFYVVARIVVLGFGALALVAAARIAERAGGRLAGWIALLLVACAPAFLADALEAKPHLPSACATLWAIVVALRYRESGRLREALLLGVLCGYAFGLVLTGIVAFAILPASALASGRGRKGWQHMAYAATAGAAVYVVTNPFLVFNLLFRRGQLGSNFGNSLAMYSVGDFWRGALRVLELLVESCGWAVLVLGLVWLVIAAGRRRWSVTLPAIPGGLIVLICIALGAGKPAEFARFLVLPAAVLSMATAELLSRFGRRRLVLLVGIAVALLPMRFDVYVRSFVADSRLAGESRLTAAWWIEAHVPTEDAVGLLQEPAPYAVPPIDFARREVFLLPAGRPVGLDPSRLPPVLVFTADTDHEHQNAWWQEYYEFARRFPPVGERLSPITWANKPVYVWMRPD